MKYEISANAIIDTLMPYMDDIQEGYQNIPRGVTFWMDSPYHDILKRTQEAEQKMILASDLLSLPPDTLYRIILIARRWYIRTDWQRCLPESEAARLVTCMIKQSTRK